MPQSFDTLRVGHVYQITNHGETHRFVLMEIRKDSVFIVKDIVTREVFDLFDLLRYGKGNDFDLIEVNE
ncbi:MAG TPA: hypothetical protein VI583_16890 [Cyclobacteriaceae bacterium]|nr:hypothetical protein [Cyclobacteriaceae bacterium]